MDLDQLQNAWTSQSVAGGGIDAAQLRRELAREVRQRSRRILRIIAVATFVFVVGWAVALAAHFTGIKPFNPVTLTTFGAAMLFDLGFLVLAGRALRRMRREAASMGETVADSLQSSRRAVEWQMRDCVLFGYGLAAVFVGGVATALVHYGAGDLPGRGLLANLVLASLFVGGIAVTLRRYYRENLVPRRAQLQRELADWQEP